MAAFKNPFPGMNPYLQQHWSDVHATLLTYIREALSGELPEDLSSRTEEHIAVESEAETREYRGDVALVETWRGGFPPLRQGGPGDGGALEVAEPIVFIDEFEPHRWIEIRDTRGRLITVIEVLSPANKRDDGWVAHRRKQRDLADGGVNLVEIDLVRGGHHVTAISLEKLTFPPGTCHHICVTRSSVPGQWRLEVYLCPLRDRLPTIRVPLRLTDPDVPLALQPLVDRCYQVGRYWQLDHTRAPDPAVAPEEETWLDERLRAAGLR